MIMSRFFAAAVIGGLLALGACGGGGGSGGPKVTIEGAQPQDITPTSLLFSDMLISGQGINERASNIACRPDLSLCQATAQGRTFTFEPSLDDPGDDVTGTIYTALGEWNHMILGALHAQIQGYQVRYALAGGIVHPNSIPRGAATWSGEMVGLDANNRAVRGGAAISLTDFGNPRIDVRLEPQSYPVMEWHGLPLQSGRFADRRTASDYIKGEFYGPNAEEVGGVFERNRIIGAFGAQR